MEGEVDAVSSVHWRESGPVSEVGLNAQDRRTPGEAAAHRFEDDKVAALDASVTHR